MKIGQFIEANLWPILVGGMALWSGFLLGQNNTTNRMDRMAEQLLAIKAEAERMKRVDACLTYHATRAETGKSGEIPRCGAE